MVTIPRKLIHEFNVKDVVSKRTIDGPGGVAFVCQEGLADPVTLYDPDNGFAALSQPVPLTRGTLRYAVDESVNAVDIHMMSPSGHFVSFSSMKAQEYNELCVDTLAKRCLLKVPFTFDWPGQVVATEFDSGLDLPVGAIIDPMMIAAEVLTLDATDDISFGILASELTGADDGFADNILLTNAGIIFAGPAVTAGGSESYFSANTLGTLLSNFLAGADSAGDVGTFNYKPYAIVSGDVSLSWTLSAGTDTAKGFILIGYTLPNNVRENAFS